MRAARSSGSIVRENGGEVVRTAVLPMIGRPSGRSWKRSPTPGPPSVVLTTGGTGFAPRDVTPEATRDVLDKEAPGLAGGHAGQTLRRPGTAMLSRAVAGIRKATLIINLPGSPKAARENFEVVLPTLAHAVELMRGRVGDCGEALSRSFSKAKLGPKATLESSPVARRRIPPFQKGVRGILTARGPVL